MFGMNTATVIVEILSSPPGLQEHHERVYREKKKKVLDERVEACEMLSDGLTWPGTPELTAAVMASTGSA